MPDGSLMFKDQRSLMSDSGSDVGVRQTGSPPLAGNVPRVAERGCHRIAWLKGKNTIRHIRILPNKGIFGTVNFGSNGAGAPIWTWSLETLLGSSPPRSHDTSHAYQSTHRFT